MNESNSNEASYRNLLLSIKQQIRSAQAKAALAVNASLIQLYWNMGKMIAENQALDKGRSNFIDQLAKDLQVEFPDITGFSKRNLFDVRRFYLFYASISVLQVVALNPISNDKAVTDISVRQAAALQQVSGEQADNIVQSLIIQIPWGHHLLILNKIKDGEAALFYLQQTIKHNWSRVILTLQIEQNLFARQGQSINNFKNTLPERQAGLAQQILKDPYNFSFLTLEASVQELDIEKQLTEQITKFLLELGKGLRLLAANIKCN